MARRRPQAPPAPPPVAAPAPLSRLEWALVLAIVVLPFVAYAPSLGGGLLWDDLDDLVATPEQRSAVGLFRAWTDFFYRQQFYPVTHTLFWLGAHLWGDAPLGYRLLVLALHVASALLLALLLRRLEVKGAFVAGLLFALHPLNVGTAAWISKLTNTLSAALALGSALALVRLLPLQPEAPLPRFERKEWRTYGLALGLFALAMLSKTAVAPLPIALGLVLWWKRGRLEAELLWLLVPLLGIAAGLGVVTSKIEEALYPLQGPMYAWGPVQSLLIASHAICFYLAKLLWPSGLSFAYTRWALSAADPLQLGCLALALALPVGLFALRGRIGRGPVVALLAGDALLFPALGFFKVWLMRFTFVADHWVYWAEMAWLPLAVGGVAYGLSRLPPKLGQALGAALTLGASAACFALTWERAPIFTSEERAWGDALEKGPHSELAEINLGWQWVQQGKLDEAYTLYQRALRDYPDEPMVLFNVGFLDMHRGSYDEALQLLEKARTEPDVDRRTRLKAERVMALTKRLRDATPEERERLIAHAEEVSNARRRAQAQ